MQGPCVPYALKRPCPSHHGGPRHWHCSFQVVLAGEDVPDKRVTQDSAQELEQTGAGKHGCVLSN